MKGLVPFDSAMELRYTEKESWFNSGKQQLPFTDSSLNSGKTGTSSRSPLPCVFACVCFLSLNLVHCNPRYNR